MNILQSIVANTKAKLIHKKEELSPRRDGKKDVHQKQEEQV